MNKVFYILLLGLLFENQTVFSQKSSNAIVAKDTLKSAEIDPLRPTKASFYSAILPGLGQAYNKKYWKIPIVYGAIGTSLYFYIDNNTNIESYIVKYNNIGIVEWKTTLGIQSYINSIIVDNSDNIIVTGRYSGDLLIYDSNGINSYFFNKK